MSYLVEVPVSEGGGPVIRVEVREPEQGLVKVARPGQVVARASQSLREMLDQVKPVAEAFANTFADLPDAPSEVALEFGVTLSAEAQLVVASAASEASFSVTLTWSRPGPASEPQL